MERVRQWIGAHRGAAAGIGAVGLVVLGVLGWLFQPWQLFLDTEVSEAFPSVEVMPEEVASEDAALAVPDEEMADDVEADEPMPEADEPAPAEAPAEPVAVVGGAFADRSHPASGTAVVYRLADGSHVLRIEDLETDNGPDLFVYLSLAAPDAPAGEFDDTFVNLGRLKGNVGDQNYELPADVDPTAWNSVVIWCDRFDVAFGSAPLAPA